MQIFYSMSIISILTAEHAQGKAFPSQVQCGKVVGSRRTGKILNGIVADDKQIPWIVSIKNENTHICGGSIISDRFILSAAHCLGHLKKAMEDDYVYSQSSGLSGLAVVLGEYSQKVEESHSVTHKIKRVIFRKDYTLAHKTVNDIMLLELTEKIQWTDHIQPICLPTNDVITFDIAIAAGWGEDYWNSDGTNDKLRYAELSIFDNDFCNHLYMEKKLGVTLSRSQMCAGVKQKPNIRKKYQDTSSGDSGGPLYVELEGRQTLVGITSAELKDRFPKPPGIYTRVFEYLQWIDEYTNHQHGSSAITNGID